MGKSRQEQMDQIQMDINAIYRSGGFEQQRAEALWSQWERLNAEEMKERVSSGS